MLVHGVFDWDPEAIEKFEAPATRPSGFYCTRYILVRNVADATDRVLADVRSYYDDTTDWFVHDLLTLRLEIEDIESAPF